MHRGRHVVARAHDHRVLEVFVQLVHELKHAARRVMVSVRTYMAVHWADRFSSEAATLM